MKTHLPDCEKSLFRATVFHSVGQTTLEYWLIYQTVFSIMSFHSPLKGIEQSKFSGVVALCRGPGALSGPRVWWSLSSLWVLQLVKHFWQHGDISNFCLHFKIQIFI